MLSVLQFETPEEYKADMGFGELRHGEVASSSGSDSSYVYTEPHFNPVTGNRKKTSVSASSLDTHEQLQLERERAADEAMKQLLGGCSALPHVL